MHSRPGEILKQVLIDTDIISYFLRNQANVVKKFKSYLNEFQTINFCIISYYSITSKVFVFFAKVFSQHVIASGAKQSYQIFKRLLRRFAPRNDTPVLQFTALCYV